MRLAILVTHKVNTNGNTVFTAKAADRKYREQRNYSMNMNEQAAHVAQEMRHRLNWTGAMEGGVLPNGDYVFVILTGEKI